MKTTLCPTAILYKNVCFCPLSRRTNPQYLLSIKLQKSGWSVKDSEVNAKYLKGNNVIPVPANNLSKCYNNITRNDIFKEFIWESC